MPSRRYVAKPDVLSGDVNGEAVLLDQQRGLYFGLNAVAARVWQLLQQPRTLTDVHAVLLGEFDVEAEVLATDLTRLAEDLRAAGLVSTAA